MFTFSKSKQKKNVKCNEGKQNGKEIAGYARMLCVLFHLHIRTSLKNGYDNNKNKIANSGNGYVLFYYYFNVTDLKKFHIFCFILS